jgi:hypothetical protein
VAAGPWTIWLHVDATSRFPDVTAVLPRSSDMAKLVLDEAEATALLQRLQEMPASGDEGVPVVLEFGPRPSASWREGTSVHNPPFIFSRSTGTGPAMAVTIDAKFFVRALSLGFRELRSASEKMPLLFCDQHRRYVVANWGPASASTERPALPAPLRPLPQKGVETMNSARNGGPQKGLETMNSARNGEPQKGLETMNSERNGGPPTDPLPTDDVLDPLMEAEALRAALAEVARRLTRLIASLRQFRKERRALHAAWSSLRPFGLVSKEET